MDIQAKIDSLTEEILILISDKYKNFSEFLNELKSYHIKEELLYDNILPGSDNYEHYYESFSKVIDEYYKNPYVYEINEKLLLELNKLTNNEFDYRDRNIIHRHFLHEIYDYNDLKIAVKKLFERFNDNSYTVLENHAFLIYNLYKIYPFFNALAIRLTCNVYLMKNDYLPLILSTSFKSDYYYIFQYEFGRFKEAYFKLIFKNLDFFKKKLGY